MLMVVIENHFQQARKETRAFSVQVASPSAMRRASARLHFLLFAGLAPLAWPITLITAIGSWRARAEDRRPLVALAAVDGLVLLGVVSLFLGAR
ncbi:MAG: hypothetical protein KC586_01070, partial [Myxococcales bacterium]|nr:hypothetical protein [Myxococcales bacterium]